jgi:transposase-like protein
VAHCSACAQDYRLVEIGRDIVGRREFVCRSCGRDLTSAVMEHLLTCADFAAGDENVEAGGLP